MKKMKKVLAIVIAFALVLALCSCAASDSTKGEVTPNEEKQDISGTVTGNEEKKDPEPEEKPEEKTEEQPEEQPEEKTEEQPEVPEELPSVGRIVGGTYESKFIGIGCELDENWTFYTDEELLQLNGQVIEQMDDEALRELLSSSNTVYDMYAYADSGLVNMSVLLENAGVLYGSVLDEQKYVEMSMDGLEQALASSGCSDVTASAVTVNLAGEEHQAIKVSAKLTEEDTTVDIYELLICKKVGNYFAVITLASFLEDITAEMAGFFYAV